MKLVTISIQAGLNGQMSNDSDALKKALDVSSKCQCLPACTSIEYEAETSQADYDFEALFRAFRLNVSDDMKE